VSKVIVITGAGVGLGRALARRFAADGDNVVLLGRTLEKVQAAAREIGERALAIHCDVASRCTYALMSLRLLGGIKPTVQPELKLALEAPPLAG